MIDKIKELFNNDFIKQTGNDKIIVDLKEKKGECNIIFKNGEFVEIKDTVIESLGNRIFIGNLAKHHSDGIILNKLDDKYNLLLIEYKENIGGAKTFSKICNQLNSTYLKISMILNILFKIEKIKVVYIFVGNISDKIQNKVLSSKTNKPNLFNNLVRKHHANINEIPFHFDISINDIFKKSDVSFIHKECNSSVDIKSI